MVHSELIMSKYIEQDAKIVYATVKGENIDQTFVVVEKGTSGK